MKIALVQYNPKWEDKESNKKKILQLVNEIKEVELIVFPEMSLTGFTMKSKEMAEGIQGDSFRYFSALAKEKSSHVMAGIIELRNTRTYNTLIHIKPDGKLVKLYRKIHPFSYSTENEHYTAGVRPAITKIKKWKIGLTICYDLRFPELYRKYGKKRTHLIVNIANWPDTRIEHWRTLLKARAIENQCYVAGVNRVGDDPKLHYTGLSSLFDPMGKEIISVENEEKVVQADLDKNYVNEVREKFPFLDDIKLI
ncbi:MAG: carbon-nitrogen family hydrolase [Ignavibacteriaceae bacterium]|jgi:predicted amidohydrolase|nr:carbon-nitrogen family hydrolase [Ignavibacteriaceae bacterium]MCW8814054.1 carbon-nitrogen family hydrolase [Chlorobium sp.]MCW8816826.1 carbon-nitrogen family hydrolase [Ignavibacteriaceae bacterium]MCW8822626.1 carbon-nitrogen family hydrolase [Ignavibacteriaceae bacterium]MCW8961928.1 carbon-nitrogen family hydrolase [Ignavibacteriaceae bacterium]